MNTLATKLYRSPFLRFFCRLSLSLLILYLWFYLQWYPLILMTCLFLVSLTIGNAVRTVAMLAGLALLAVAHFTSFEALWLWLAGCLLIAGTLFVESLPHLRALLDTYLKTYRDVSKESET